MDFKCAIYFFYTLTPNYILHVRIVPPWWKWTSIATKSHFIAVSVSLMSKLGIAKNPVRVELTRGPFPWSLGILPLAEKSDNCCGHSFLILLCFLSMHAFRERETQDSHILSFCFRRMTEKSPRLQMAILFSFFCIGWMDVLRIRNLEKHKSQDFSFSYIRRAL
jgi:hypothetical protein